MDTNLLAMLLLFTFKQQTRRQKPIQQKQKAGIVTSLNDTSLTTMTYGIRHSGPGWSGVWNLWVV